MPAPTKPQTTNGAGDASASQPTQKSMTKAERRELQEKQRAAKLAQKQPGSGSNSKPKAPPASSSSVKKTSAASGSGKSTDANKLHPPKDSGAAMSKDGSGSTHGEDPAQKSRGLRIFSHFGLPKSPTHIVKGDIHPAIVRLALQFSEFKISGANARCIATLTAFKTVSYCVVSVLQPNQNSLHRLFKTTLHHPIIPSLGIL